MTLVDRLAIAAIALVTLIVVIVAGLWHWKSGIEDAAALRYVADANAQQLAFGKRVKRIEEEKLKQRSEYEERIAAMSSNHQVEVKRLSDRVNGLLADGVRLRDKGDAASAGIGKLPKADSIAAAACRCDGEASGQLSRSASEFLLRLAGEADQVAEQLGYAQKIIEQQRALCNGRALSP